MQTIPLSRQTVQEIEDVIDAIDVATADGVVTAQEAIVILAEVREAHQTAMETDDAQAAGISFIRNGRNSQRSKRLTRAYDGDHAA